MKQAAPLKVSEDSLVLTGLGHLFVDTEFEQFCGDGEVQMLEVVLARWKKLSYDRPQWRYNVMSLSMACGREFLWHVWKSEVAENLQGGTKLNP